jgi:hypothetical protein
MLPISWHTLLLDPTSESVAACASSVGVASAARMIVVGKASREDMRMAAPLRLRPRLKLRLTLGVDGEKAVADFGAGAA